MNFKRYITALLTVLFICSIPLQAESIKSLKRKQKKAKENIELTNRLLKETQRSQKSTVNNLTILKKQISERQILITALNDEISILDTNIVSVEKERFDLQEKLTRLKSEYAKSIYHLHYYKNNYNKILFIFSAQSFSEAYRRFQYIKQYSQYQKEQSILIQKTEEGLAEKHKELLQLKGEKSTTLMGKEKENQKLQTAQKEKEQMLTQLSKKEKDLQNKLKTEQKNILSLNKKIDDLIAKEIAEAERKAKAKAKEKAKQTAKSTKTSPNTSSNTKAKTGYTKPVESLLSKEESIVAGNFQQNKGKLPWPARGVITGHFGVQKHAVLEHVQVNNKGIYIQTQPNTDACSIFDGEVTQIFSIPGNNNAIIVKHGDYRTVYANITTAYVRVGDKIKTKQKLGRIFVDTENGNKTELYFMLYHGSMLQNPENWIQ